MGLRIKVKKLIKGMVAALVLVNSIALQAGGGNSTLANYDLTKNDGNGAMELSVATDCIKSDNFEDFIKALNKIPFEKLAQQNEDGDTLLHLAALSKNTDFVKTLVVYGAPSIQSRDGKMPFDMTDNEDIKFILVNGWLGLLPPEILKNVISFLTDNYSPDSLADTNSYFNWQVDEYRKRNPKDYSGHLFTHFTIPLVGTVSLMVDIKQGESIAILKKRLERELKQRKYVTSDTKLEIVVTGKLMDDDYVVTIESEWNKLAKIHVIKKLGH